MKKQIIFLTFTCILSLIGFTQNATSVANGNWTNPTTWNCVCVPIPGYSVTINHSVTLNTSMSFSLNGMTINTGASLIKDIATRDILLNGGSITNKGYMDVRFILAQTGSWSNTGTITARSIDNYVNFTNSGLIFSVDSMRNSSTMINNGRMLNIDSIMHAGTFTNNGKCTHHFVTNIGNFTNNNYISFIDITNIGTFTNSDSVIGSRSMWNMGKLNNTSGSLISLTKSLLNKAIPTATASLNNNGRIRLADSYYNFDTIRGITGSIVVQDSSVNYGFMKQTFDFCDLTPNPSPNIDYNFGTVSSGITYCVNTGIKDYFIENINIYPNPANTQLTIDLGGLENVEITIYRIDGTIIKQSQNADVINTSDFPCGIYFVSIIQGNNKTTKKLQIIK